MVDSFEVDLLKGIAGVLAAGATRVPLTYRAAGAYSGSEVGIVIDIEPQDDRPAVTITTYVVSDDVGGEDSVVGVQFKLRHPSAVKIRDMEADVFDLFHGRQRGMLGGVTLIAAARRSGTPIGQDRNKRLGRTENYYLTVARPTTRRI